MHSWLVCRKRRVVQSPRRPSRLPSADEFSVGFGSPSVVRDADLDTFDRRLGAAGFSLHHLSDSVDQRLVLISPDAGTPLTMPITKVRWPALVTDLPAGAIREALAPLATIRALMVLDEQIRRIRHGELRNEDQKIVARLELVEQGHGPDGGARPAGRAPLARVRWRGPTGCPPARRGRTASGPAGSG